MNQRAHQKAESRDRILGAAAQLLRDKGAGGTSVDAAMRGAALTVGAFYAHFDSKEDLLAQAFARAMDEMGELVRVAAADQTGCAGLSGVVGTYLSQEHLRQSRHGCPLPAVTAEAAVAHDDRLHNMVAKGLDTMHARLLGIASGEVDAEVALALVSVLVGSQVLARATRGTPLSHKLLEAGLRAAEALLSKESR